MVSFYLVRHGEAEASSHGAALTTLGREQAAALGARLTDISFDAVWRSDMVRAVETAEILAGGRADLAWLVSPALRELDFSSAPPLDAGAEGYRAWEVQALVPMAAGLRGWLDRLPAAPAETPGGGAQGPALRTSVGVPTHDSRILVVAHSGPIRLLICQLLGIPVEHHWAFRVDHGSLTVVERGADMGTLVLLNDRCHLAGIANPAEAHHGR